jgi:hypothetical protein
MEWWPVFERYDLDGAVTNSKVVIRQMELKGRVASVQVWEG